jgi:hypothetical protein
VRQRPAATGAHDAGGTPADDARGEHEHAPKICTRSDSATDDDGATPGQEAVVEPEHATQQKRILIGIGSAVAVVAILVGLFALLGDDDDDPPTTTSTTSTTEPTTSSSESTTTTVDPEVVDQALFPLPSAAEQFSDPVELARTFATDLLGFRDDVLIGAFAQGDARSGEVEVRAFEDGPPTLVLVRQLTANDQWFVIGASTDTIRLDTPINGARISSPQPLLGAASAFEGHVDVTLRADDRTEPIARHFVTGRGDGVLGSFEDALTYEVPDGVTHGVLVLSAPSAEDGSTFAATAVRVRL